MLGYNAAVRFLETTDEEERSRLQVLAFAARRIQADHDLERATMIANSVGKMLGGGS